MSRFRSADEPAVPYSELRPERFDPFGIIDPSCADGRRRLDEMRRIFMQEIPLPEEIARDRPRQRRGNR
jgi:hypothetical protein